MKKETIKKHFKDYIFLYIAMLIIAGLVLFCLLKLDNLMHSDTTAEVILANLLSKENRLLTKNWFYSTEIRIVYSHLIMIPLFKMFSSYKLVKLLSIYIFYILVVFAFKYFMKSYKLEKKWFFFGMILLFAPWSNEYLDMMYIGCFSTSQMIMTYFLLGFLYKTCKTSKRNYLYMIVLSLISFVLGLSGLRYLASLFIPVVIGFAALYIFDQNKCKDEKNYVLWFIRSIVMTGFAGIGFLINKFVLAKNYSFDTTTTEVVFVSLSEVPERFLKSIELMLEFVGYYPVEVVSGRGIVNAGKFLFLVFFIYCIAYLVKNRAKIKDIKWLFFLYFFLAAFLLNWYMLVFTKVLLQYRYWLPIFAVGILLIVIFFHVYEGNNLFKNWLLAFMCLTALSSLYGELWQDVKYNDCAKRYDYVDFLEENNYTFGYATFWNSSVTEYLTDGKVEVGNLGGENGVAAPYEWLTKKAYYKEGYHTGKTFLLLARTEEAGMLKGDFTVMEDPVKVYEDEYYAIYEGQGMYLFSEE